MMEEQLNEQVQSWVDKLAAMNSNITKNNIMEWAASVPLIPLDQFDTVPLYLYGDATLDKAIVDIIQQGGVTEPAVNDIYGVLSKTYRAAPAEDDSVSLSPETVASLPTSNNRPGDWNAMIVDTPPSKEHKEQERVPLNTVNRRRIGDYITTDKYESAHRVAAQDNSQNAVYFSNGGESAKITPEGSGDAAIDHIAMSNALLRQHGFTALSYDDNMFILSNGPLTCVIDKNLFKTQGKIAGEDNDGKPLGRIDSSGRLVPFESIDAFVHEYVEKQPLETQNYFSRNFAESADVIPEEQKPDLAAENELTIAQLANIMTLFQNDLLYMHHHSVGDDFDAVHSITQELYEKAGDHVDRLAELAIRVGEQIGNMSDAQAIASTIYDTITQGDVDIDRMEAELNRKGGIVLGALRRCRKYSSDIMSVIDELIDDWATEVEYKNAARQKNFSAAPETVTTPSEVATEVAEIASAVVDDLTNQYSVILDTLEAKTSEYESAAAMKEQNQAIIDDLKSKITPDDEETNSTIATACADYEAKNVALTEKMDELLPEIEALLQKQKEFKDVTACTTRSEYKKELGDVIKDDAAPKNFAAEGDRPSRVDNTPKLSLAGFDNDALEREYEKRNLGTSKGKVPAKSPRESVYEEAEKDVVKLEAPLQHLEFIKRASSESQRRQLEEMFKEYDRQNELDEKDWQKQQQLLLDERYLGADIALQQQRQDAAQAYLEQNLGRDTAYQIAKQRILDKEANLKQFRKTASDGIVDIVVNELPKEKLISTYDKILGNKLMQSNPAIDGMIVSALGTTYRNKETIGSIAKAAISALFSRTTTLDRKTNRVAERLLRMGFSYKEIEPVTSGKMFSRIPEECLDVDSMTKEALIHLTGSVNKGRKMFANRRQNFSNENYDVVRMQSMPARYKYSITNPRYDFSENSWNAGDSNEANSSTTESSSC